MEMLNHKVLLVECEHLFHTGRNFGELFYQLTAGPVPLGGVGV